jgi:hypothetical protein
LASGDFGNLPARFPHPLWVAAHFFDYKKDQAGQHPQGLQKPISPAVILEKINEAPNLYHSIDFAGFNLYTKI